MEFSVSKSALLNELNTTQGVVERKTTIPILSNLLVEAKGSRLTVTATDLELSIRTSCEAKVKKEGAGTIPAKKLLELVRLLPEGEIKVRLLENHWVEIVSDKKKYKLVGMAKENFPALPTMPHALVKIPAAVMESLIAKTKFAISMEESRYTLNGGLLIMKPDTVAMVATDGHRLALAETDQKLSGLNGEVKVLIPKKAMDEVEKLSSVAGSEAQIDFAKDESHLFFQVGHRLLISRILTGQFPNYEAVLPRENNKQIVIERAELSDAVRRVAQLADQRSHAVKFAVTNEGVEIDRGAARAILERSKRQVGRFKLCACAAEARRFARRYASNAVPSRHTAADRLRRAAFRCARRRRGIWQGPCSPRAAAFRGRSASPRGYGRRRGGRHPRSFPARREQIHRRHSGRRYQWRGNECARYRPRGRWRGCPPDGRRYR